MPLPFGNRRESERAASTAGQFGTTDDLKVRLHWLMVLRAVVVTLLLGLSIRIQAAKGEAVPVFYGLIVFTYAVTIVYALVFLRWGSDRTMLRRLAKVQLVVDLAIETMLVARTGGVESPFSVFYLISVSLASLILGRRSGLTVAGLSMVLYGLVANAQLYDLTALIPRGRLSIAETLQAFGIQAVGIMAVGLLSGRLAEQLKHADLSLLEKSRGLSRLQAFHENVVESLSSGLFTTDPDGRITSINRAAADIMKVDINSARGRLWWETFQWQEPQLFGMTPANVQGPYRFEAEGRRADGSRVVLGMTLAPLNEGGQRTGVVGLFQDLTQVRELEEEMRRREWLASLGEMSAGMAHEIRNPLAALGGAMQILRKDINKDDSSRNLMDIAIRETARLDAIITEFLLYARPPALNLKDCDLNALIRETLDLLRHEASVRLGIRIVPAIPSGVLVAAVDPDQMKQVFWNLAINAFDAMPAGGTLTVATRKRRVGGPGKSGDVVEIAFRDTGEGIKKDALDKIFLPFFTTKKRGSGLGLAAVHRIVDLHGGWIRVDSQEQAGSEFVVCLPVSAEAGLRLWHEGREPWKRS